MDQYENDRIGRREVRKKKRINTFLNVSIGVVGLIIVFITGTLFFGLGSDDQATPANNNNEEVENENEENGGINEDANISDSETSENEENDEEADNNLGVEGENSNNEINEINGNNDNNNENNQENENNTGSNNNGNNNENNENENNTNGDNNEAVDEEDWGPIGTVQEEPFSAVYDSEHVNWEEMTRAIEYATGLSEDEMTIWRLENGGDDQTAIGTVSSSDHENEPYEVELNWVEEEGWEPVSKEQLSSNPYN